MIKKECETSHLVYKYARTHANRDTHARTPCFRFLPVHGSHISLRVYHRCKLWYWNLGPNTLIRAGFVAEETFHGPGGATDVARACDWLSAFLSLLGSQRSRRRYATEKASIWSKLLPRGSKVPKSCDGKFRKGSGGVKNGRFWCGWFERLAFQDIRVSVWAGVKPHPYLRGGAGEGRFADVKVHQLSWCNTQKDSEEFPDCDSQLLDSFSRCFLFPQRLLSSVPTLWHSSKHTPARTHARHCWAFTLTCRTFTSKTLTHHISL